MHHVVLCTKIKIRWLNEICFLWSHFISGHVFACCMPVSLYLSLSLCLSFVFLSALEDACFGSLCHVHHHQEHPHLPRGLLQLCTFRLVSLFTLYLVLVSIAASLFPCKFSSSNVFLFWPNAIVFKDIFSISLVNFCTLEHCVCVYTLVHFLFFSSCYYVPGPQKPWPPLQKFI